MSLKGFHVVFITVSTLLAAFCAVWCVRAWQFSGGADVAAGAALSILAGLALVVYGVAFYRKMGQLQ